MRSKKKKGKKKREGKEKKRHLRRSSLHLHPLLTPPRTVIRRLQHLREHLMGARVGDGCG